MELGEGDKKGLVEEFTKQFGKYYTLSEFKQGIQE
jgi:hypothetical protein